MPLYNVARLYITVEPDDITRAQVELGLNEVTTADAIEAEFLMVARDGGLKRVARVVFADGTEDIYDTVDAVRQ